MAHNTAIYKKVNPLNRSVAKAIDIIIILVFALILNPIGPLIAIFYSLCADGFDGKSIGKRLVNLQTINSITRNPAGFKESIIRNIPIGIFIFFASIPVFWIVMIIIGIPLLLLEVYLFWMLDSGNRIGDILADTTVVQLEYKFSSKEDKGNKTKNKS
jgi:uncharacterized RDD family membrane protein YckC